MPDPTIKDVARVAGVSVGTASMALNERSGVRHDTRKKVLEAASQLNYHPNKYARLLTSKRTNMIGLIITDISNPFFGVIIDKLQRCFADVGYDIMLGITRGSITKERQWVDKFIEMQVDGMLIVPSHKQAPDTTHLRVLAQRGIPFCFITAYYTDVTAPCVMTDLSEGSYELTKYLLTKGHRSITYVVANRSIPVSNLRVEGYLRAFHESGHPFRPQWVVVSEPTFEGGYLATGEILDRERPDAILAMNDIMAMGVLKCLKERGLRAPRDISIAGYDDLVYASLLETTLTTVRQPMDQMCQRAAELLLRKIEAPDEVAEKLLLRPTLILRDSTDRHPDALAQ